jgi:hypothetical protein
MPNIIHNTIILENNINTASFKDEALEGFNLEGGTTYLLTMIFTLTLIYLFPKPKKQKI